MSYTFFVVSAAFLWNSETRGNAPGAFIHELVFIDFFGNFLLVLLTTLIPVRDSHNPLAISGWVSGGIVILAGVWIMNGLAGPRLAALWAVALATNFLQPETLLRTAILRIGWAILSALIIAFFGSIAGVDPDKLLTANTTTAVSWGLLYFGGVALERFGAAISELRQAKRH